ncbi:MAG: ABC transporter substrate-binding protein [Holosporaceae bacterium]|jgi:polar amino acid transport system substrate-binding protein|nr:ABC transporter substrate-binding protein [Holosporaceae bacterium]
MKRYIYILLSVAFALIPGCKENSEKNEIKFAVCADYPPFEYYDNGKMVGFDIELAIAVAHKLGMKAVFDDMQLPAVLVSVQNGHVEAAISALAATEEREKNCCFSVKYYSENFAIIYRKEQPITTPEQMANAKIACQLGSTMEIWMKKNVPSASLVLVDNNNLAVESLKAGIVGGVFIDEIQASVFCKKNPNLAYVHIAASGEWYAIAMKKESKWKEKIDKALKELISSGEVEKLKKKWLVE